MRAYAVEGFGEMGSLRELPTPDPAEGEVRIRVRAAGVNPVDVAVIAGYLKDYMEHRFPLIPGMDGSGVIDAVGPGVHGWAEGDEVLAGWGKGAVGEGTFAEYATVAVGAMTRKPASIDHRLAAAIPLAGVTAMTLVDAIAPAEGETVLALGASGGVGSYLVQLLAAGAVRVVGVCSGPNADYVRERGATDVIDYTAEDIGEALRALCPDGIVGIADMVGDRELLAGLSEQVRPGGSVASAVSAADEEALAKRDVKAANIAAMPTAAKLDVLVSGLVDGSLKAPQIQAFPLDDVGGALALIGTHHVRGKIVLDVS